MKKLFALLLAGLLVASFAACTNNPADTDESTGSDATTTDNYIVIGTDESGNDITETVTEPTSETENDPSETDPVFTDIEKTIVVFASVATVRTSTVIADNNAVGWPTEGRELVATGESEKWYRIEYEVNGETTTCYIAKTVAADISVLDAFTECEPEEIEVIVDALNVRSYPSAESTNSIRGSLTKGTKVTRVAVSESWSRIVYEVVSETETDEEGNAVVETKYYYVSNDCIKAPEAETTETAEETTVAEETTAAEEN